LLDNVAVNSTHPRRVSVIGLLCYRYLRGKCWKRRDTDKRLDVRARMLLDRFECKFKIVLDVPGRAFGKPGTRHVKECRKFGRFFVRAQDDHAPAWTRYTNRGCATSSRALHGNG
jgi:hypothetical protein